MARAWAVLLLLAGLQAAMAAQATPEDEFVAAPAPSIDLMSEPSPAPQPRDKEAAPPESSRVDEDTAEITAGIPEPADGDDAPPVASRPAPAPAPAASAEPDFFQRHIDEFNRASAEETATAGRVEQAAPPEESGTAYVLQVLFSLLILCGVIVVGGWLFRRFGRNTPLLAGPSLGTIMGRVYLTPRVSLHYVRTGGRVLVVGITQQGIQPVAEFDADTFDAAQADDNTAPAAAPPSPADFLAQLRGHAASATGSAGKPDDDLSTLRGEIQQLQEYLRSRPRDVEE